MKSVWNMSTARAVPARPAITAAKTMEAANGIPPLKGLADAPSETGAEVGVGGGAGSGGRSEPCLRASCC